MSKNPNVVSVGDDFRSWPRHLWGTRDRARAAQQDRARAEVDRLTKGLPSRFEAVEPQLRPMRFDLHPPERRRSESARGRQIDKILDALGIR